MFKRVISMALVFMMFGCSLIFVEAGTANNYADNILEYFSDEPMVIRSKYSDTAVGDDVSMVEYAGKVYCFGSNSTQVYDPASNSWAAAPVMPVLRSEYAVAENGGKIYFIGGKVDNQNTRRTDVFNTQDNTWSDGAESPLYYNVIGAEAISVGNKIYCFGGYDSIYEDQKIDETYILDTQTSKWSYGEDMPEGGYYTAAAVGEEIYCTTRYYGDGNHTYVYNIAENSWSTRQVRPNYAYGTISNQEGKLMKLNDFLIFINHGSDNNSKPRYAYNPSEDVWVVLPDTLKGMDFPAGRTTIIGDRIYTIKDSIHDGVMQSRLEITYIYSNENLYPNSNNIAVGLRHILVYKDGVLMSKGNNDYGQLGDGTMTDSDNFVSVETPWTAKGESVQRVVASANMSYVITDKYNLYGWGQNENSQLGNGSMENVSIPELLAENVADVAAGTAHTVILKRDATVWASGNNTYGQLGNNSTSTKRRFARVYENASAIDAGDYQSYLIDSTGSLYACGRNNLGQLGINTSIYINKTTYTHVLDGVTQISAGFNHAVAVNNSGVVYCWGSNRFGQLGLDLSVVISSAPVQFRNMISPGNIKAGGNITAYVDNGYLYQCGYLGLKNVFVPELINKISGVKEFDVSELCIAIDKDNKLWQWGISTYDQKFREATSISEPVRIAGLKNVTSIDAKRGQVLAIRNNTALVAWGNGYFATGSDREEMFGYAKEINTMTSVHSAVRGKHHNIMILDYDVQGWGSNTNYPMGDIGSKVRTVTDTCMSAMWREDGDGYEYLDNDPIEISAGTEFSLVKRREMIFWSPYVRYYYTLAGVGKNGKGQLGLGDIPYTEDPEIIIKAEVSSFSAGDSFGIALIESDLSENIISDENILAGGIYVWGANESGQLGLGAMSGVKVPTLMPQDFFESSGEKFTEVKAGPNFCLGLTNYGNVYGWGKNSVGQLGLGSNNNQKRPRKIPGLTNVKSIGVGLDFAMAIKKDGTLWTWGNNDKKQLGRIIGVENLPGQVLGISNAKLVSGGTGFTVVVDTKGDVYTFGTNEDGALGIWQNVPQTIYSGIGEEPIVTSLNISAGRSVYEDANGVIRRVKNNE